MGETTVLIPTRVLVLGMAHDDGTIAADELYPIAEACGQTPEQVRSCLRRLVAQGLFTRTGAGRRATYVPTEAGRGVIDNVLQRTRLAFAQDAAGRGWDRRWHLVGYAVPETRRHGRDALRDRLVAFGGAPLHGGLYVSPHPWEDDVRREAKRLNLADHLTLAQTDDLEVAGVRDPRELVAMLWPLEQAAERYTHFNENYGQVLDLLEGLKRDHGRIPDTLFLPYALRMAVDYAECSAIDPYLPPELLPRPWAGRAAREILGRSRRLAVVLREGGPRPALFGTFDELLETLP